MSKLNLFEAGILKTEEDDGTWVDAQGEVHDGRITYVEFILDPDNKEVEVIETRNKFDNANGKAAISAYADLLAHGMFDHPDTDVETGTVFIRATANTKAFYASDIGFINVDNDDPKFPKVDPSVHPEGVAWLHRRNRKYVLTTLDNEGEIAQARYVDWLQAASLGVNIRVRTVPFQPWINAVLENLSITDAEERLEDRNARYAKKMDRENVSQHVRKGMSLVKKGDTTKVPTGAIVVRLFGSGDALDITSMAPQQVKVHTSRGNDYYETWDGGFSSRLAFEKIANSKGWTVELNPEL